MGLDPRRRLQLAQDQLDRGQVDVAIETLASLLGDEPEHADGHALLALCLVRRKRLHAARLEAGRALELEPESPFAHIAVAVVETASRRFASAERHLFAARELAPALDAVERQLAELYLLWGRTETAERHARRALELEPDDLGHLALLGQIAHAVGDRAEAARYARSVLERDPEQVDALVLLGRCELDAGDVTAAREHAVWALQLDPEDPGALALLCAIKARGSVWLGLWWRFQAFVSAGSGTRAVLLLVGMYLLYRAGTILLEDNGRADLAEPLALAWLAFCVYTWVAPSLFLRSLRREMQQVSLREDF